MFEALRNKREINRKDQKIVMLKTVETYGTAHVRGQILNTQIYILLCSYSSASR